MTAPGPARIDHRWQPVMARLLAIPPVFVSLSGGAVVWEIVGRMLEAPFLPPFSAVVAQLWVLIGTGQILGSLGASLLNLLMGFGLSLAIGVGLGILMGWFDRAEDALGIYVYALLTAPSLVFAPIFFSLFGAGRESIVGVIIMYSVFIMIISTASALRSVPRELIEMGRSFGASNRHLLLRIALPSAAPMIFAGIRLGVGRAVIGMINGEMFIAVVGLGRIVTRAGARFDGASVLAILLIIIAIAVVAVALVQWLDRRVTHWLPATSRSSS